MKCIPCARHFLQLPYFIYYPLLQERNGGSKKLSNLLPKPTDKMYNEAKLYSLYATPKICADENKSPTASNPTWYLYMFKTVEQRQWDT